MPAKLGINFKNRPTSKQIIMKNCIIIHWCPSTPEDKSYNKHWIPWVKNELTSLWIPTETPLMPKPWQVVYEDFKEAFESYNVDENSILIWHSCGTNFLVRWLGETKKRIDTLVLVAPWKVNTEQNTYGEEFYGFTIDPTIQDRVKRIIVFTSDNEWDDGKESIKMYQEVLNMEVISLPGRGHYIERHMGTEEFPELIHEITK